MKIMHCRLNNDRMMLNVGNLKISLSEMWLDVEVRLFYYSIFECVFKNE